MPEAKLPEKKNAYRFRGNAIDVIAKLPKRAAFVIRRGGHVTVTVEWSESEGRESGHDPGRVKLPGGSMLGAILAGQERMRERCSEPGDPS